MSMAIYSKQEFVDSLYQAGHQKVFHFMLMPLRKTSQLFLAMCRNGRGN